MHAFMSMPNCWMQNAPWLLLGLYILKLHDCIKVAKMCWVTTNTSHRKLLFLWHQRDDNIFVRQSSNKQERFADTIKTKSEMAGQSVNEQGKW